MQSLMSVIKKKKKTKMAIWLIDSKKAAHGTFPNTQNDQNNTSKENLQWCRICWKGKAQGRFLFFFSHPSDECVQRGVRDGFPHTHLHFLLRLTDGQRRQSRRKSQNQTPAMETRLRLRCVCVLALVILKGKVMRKSYFFFFFLLPNWQTNSVAAARRREKVTSVQN